MSVKYNVMFTEVIGELFDHEKSTRCNEYRKPATIYLPSKKPPVITPPKQKHHSKNQPVNSEFCFTKGNLTSQFFIHKEYEFSLMLGIGEVIGISCSRIHWNINQSKCVKLNHTVHEKGRFRYEFICVDQCVEPIEIGYVVDGDQRMITILPWHDRECPVVTLGEKTMLYSKNIESFILQSGSFMNLKMSKGLRVASNVNDRKFKIHLADNYKLIKIDPSKKTVKIDGVK